MDDVHDFSPFSGVFNVPRNMKIANNTSISVFKGLFPSRSPFSCFLTSKNRHAFILPLIYPSKTLKYLFMKDLWIFERNILIASSVFGESPSQKIHFSKNEFLRLRITPKRKKLSKFSFQKSKKLS